MVLVGIHDEPRGDALRLQIPRKLENRHDEGPRPLRQRDRVPRVVEVVVREEQQVRPGDLPPPPGAFGFPSNHGSMSAVFPSRMEKPECPNQRIRTDAMAALLRAMEVSRFLYNGTVAHS